MFLKFLQKVIYSDVHAYHSLVDRCRGCNALMEGSIFLKMSHINVGWRSTAKVFLLSIEVNVETFVHIDVLST